MVIFRNTLSSEKKNRGGIVLVEKSNLLILMQSYILLVYIETLVFLCINFLNYQKRMLVE